VAVGTQGLQVGRVVVISVTVYVVYVKLATVLRHKAAVLTLVFLVSLVWILVLVDVSFVDSLASVFTGQAFGFRIS